MRIEVSLLTVERALAVFTKIESRTCKPVALWCCNDGWEIFMNEAVFGSLEFVVLASCKERDTVHEL